MKSLWKPRGFTLIHTRCESRSVSLPFFKLFFFRVRVRVLNRTVRTFHGFISFWICDDFSKMKWVWEFTWVSIWRFEPFVWFLALDFLWWAGFTPFFLLLIRILWNPSLLLLLLLLRSDACDYARSALPPVACSRWIASTTIQWWGFIRISENCSNLCCICVNFVTVWFCELNSMVHFEVFGTKLIWIRVECELGFMQVLELLWILWFWSVTAKREKIDSVCVMWREFCGSLIRVALYRLTSGCWTNWNVTCGLSWLAWPFGQNLIQGPICKKNETKGTNMQKQKNNKKKMGLIL